MSTAYDIYNTSTANLVGSFWSQEEALAEVGRTLKEEGEEAIQSWAVWPTDLSGQAIVGDELAQRAIEQLNREYREAFRQMVADNVDIVERLQHATVSARYDLEEDLLEVLLGGPHEAVCMSMGGGLWLQLDPETNKIVGIELEHYREHLKRGAREAQFILAVMKDGGLHEATILVPSRENAGLHEETILVPSTESARDPLDAMRALAPA